MFEFKSLVKICAGLLALLVALLALCNCAPLAEPAGAAVEPTAEPTIPAVGMANPAAVFCEEQGHDYIIRDTAEGQAGVCVFITGGECDGWAYFNGDCQPPAGDEPGADAPEPAPEPAAPAAQPVVAWYGYVTSDAGRDVLVLYPEGVGQVELVAADAGLQALIAGLRDKPEPARNAHFWGALDCAAAPEGLCRLHVDRLRPDGPGELFAADPVEGWQGVLFSGQPGLQVDDAFVLLGDWNIHYGIWAEDSTLARQLIDLHDSGTVVRIWGQLLAGIPDANGTQIQVTRLELADAAGAALPAAPVYPEPQSSTVTYINDHYGYQLELPAAATVTERGVESFAADELPAGTTPDAYMAELQARYGDGLCVQIDYGLAYLTISAPDNAGFRYALCGRSGLGAGETAEVSQELTIAGRTYTAQGVETRAVAQDCDTLDCHNEMLVLVLEDGTRIEFGARSDSTATYQDYLVKGKPQILAVVESLTRLP